MITTVTIFVFFVLYMGACIADGHDVKPLWKRWLGTKLEQKANQLKPINYCRPYDCDLLEKACRPKHEFRVPVQVSTIEHHTIEHIVRIDEGQMFDVYMRRQMMERAGVPAWQMSRYESIEGMIDEAKHRCMNAVLDTAKQFVDIQVINDEHRMEYVVVGKLEVGTKRY